MNDEQTTGAHEDCDHEFIAWDRDQRARKRRIALVIMMAMALGYGGAMAYGSVSNAHAATRAPAAAHTAAR